MCKLFYGNVITWLRNVLSLSFVWNGEDIVRGKERDISPIVVPLIIGYENKSILLWEYDNFGIHYALVLKRVFFWGAEGGEEQGKIKIVGEDSSQKVDNGNVFYFGVTI